MTRTRHAVEIECIYMCEAIYSHFLEINTENHCSVCSVDMVDSGMTTEQVVSVKFSCGHMLSYALNRDYHDHNISFFYHTLKRILDPQLHTRRGFQIEALQKHLSEKTGRDPIKPVLNVRSGIEFNIYNDDPLQNKNTEDKDKEIAEEEDKSCETHLDSTIAYLDFTDK